jgi:hypothetical protein
MERLCELVSVMEQNPCYLINNLYGECESRFLEIISTVVSKEQKDVDHEKLHEVS